MLDSVQDPHTPKTIEDIVGNEEIWKSTYKRIRENTASHIVLIGPAGCGKSVFLRLALSTCPTLVINCIGNSGLRDQRDTIRFFARGSKTMEGRMRWVILEHADSLTADTQAFLRRMLETTSSTTRFVFECKDGGAITEPIYSRSMIVNVESPECTELVYELNRRTNYQLQRNVVDSIVAYSYGNVRKALLQAFAKLHCDIVSLGNTIIEELLECRPKDEKGWIEWALHAESVCKLEGIDLRDVLRMGWPTNTIVANTCAQWSRLGGTSPRTLFFDCVSSLCVKTV
jgi:DNA polymerase III delta prime subunit